MEDELKCPFCGLNHSTDVMICPSTNKSLKFSNSARSVGQVIKGKYQIVKLLGKGGMGSVYEAKNIHIDKKVAIKILLPTSSESEQAIERFRREAKSAASIGHENIVDIYDLDTTEEGVVFIVMEYLSGYDLADLLVSKGAQPLPRIASIGVQTARGLAAAHARGIIHRDLKPENIFLVQRKEGEKVKIVDFGIAMIKEHGSVTRLTTDGVLLGTPFYMSPEQAMGKKNLDHRVDIYALGAVLFEALTGTVLFSGETYLEIISKHQFESPPSLRERNPDINVSAEVEKLISKMLSKNPEDRPQSMEEVEKILLPFTRQQWAETYPNAHEYAETIAELSTGSIPGADSRSETLRGWIKTSRKKKTIIFSSIAGAMVVVTLIIIAILQLSKKTPSQPTYPVEIKPIKPSMQAPATTTLLKRAKQGKKEKIKIRIETNPQNARIKLLGKSYNFAPVEIELEPSNELATVVVEAPGFKTQKKIINLNEDTLLHVNLKKLKPGSSKIKKDESGMKPASASKSKKLGTLDTHSPYRKNVENK